MADGKLGVWIVGASGNVATTAILGLAALSRNLAPRVGLVTELPAFEPLGLASWDSFVVGGHEIRQPRIVAAARELAAQHVVPPELVEACREELEGIEARVRPGIAYGCGKAIRQLAEVPVAGDEVAPWSLVEQIMEDLKKFQTSTGVDRVVVINLASTEPPTPEGLAESWRAYRDVLGRRGVEGVRASTLYAIAAFQLSLPYINFSPSAGASPTAVGELALERGVCHAGQDGKTGETLLKTVLAPMFASRNLEVMSWVGHNIFGNLDAVVLDDPENRASKIRTKDRVLAGTLGYEPETLVSIERIASLGDWKTAWDHIHFRGFLGTFMTLQFTWQGSDSALAAPLALDLVRLVDRSQRGGETGALAHLASFFKSPLGAREHAFAAQFEMLLEWVARSAAKG
jgi:myo-inositol-1-phosphate synthase